LQIRGQLREFIGGAGGLGVHFGDRFHRTSNGIQEFGGLNALRLRIAAKRQ